MIYSQNYLQDPQVNHINIMNLMSLTGNQGKIKSTSLIASNLLENSGITTQKENENSSCLSSTTIEQNNVTFLIKKSLKSLITYQTIRNMKKRYFTADISAVIGFTQDSAD